MGLVNPAKTEEILSISLTDPAVKMLFFFMVKAGRFGDFILSGKERYRFQIECIMAALQLCIDV